MSPRSETRVRRFTPIQRLFHVFLMLTFLTQGATGLSRMYIQTGWGKNLAAVFGGYESALTVHKWIGILMICGFMLHIFYLFFTVKWNQAPHVLFGPDSLIPGPRDAKAFFQHLGWMFGIRDFPSFDRWGYWEKFDYWAVFWGMVLIGTTGLILAYPLAATRYIPGWGLNVAFWIHRIEALLAMAHVFVIHFFIAHFRRHNFPMDRAMFEGSVDLDAVRHERPAWIRRLEDSEALDPLRVDPANTGFRIFSYLFGYAAILCGLFLLIGGLVNAPRITW